MSNTMVTTSPAALRFRQITTVVLLFGGYGALYFCRADLSVATPFLVDELARAGCPTRMRSFASAR